MHAELPAGERPAARAPLPKHLRDRSAAGQHGRNAMIRAPRVSHYIGKFTTYIRVRIPARLGRTTISRTTMAYAGAGLALTGVAGFGAVATLGGHPVAAAGTRHPANRAVEARAVAGHTSLADPRPRHAQLPVRDMLTPVGTTGPQTWMQITPARYANAKTIVHQAIASHMGLRSAVIAVATSMQESTLLNLTYGDSDSLGLFQQRPSAGWGTPAQILRPAYAAGAFLHALRSYQASNPDWARQPLWEPAQGVQESAFPTAYARWEAQAAHLVASVAEHTS